MEELDACLLWPSDDLIQMRTIFFSHAQKNDTMPMAQLFQVIDEIGFGQLDCKSADSQKWLIGIIHKVYAKSKRPETPSKSNISFEEFVRIVTAATKAKGREPRRAEFKAEQLARREAGFQPSEMEDLRELHGTYLSMRAEGSSSTLAQLLHLFQACQVRGLDKKEIVQLRTIIESYTNLHDAQDDGKAPFAVFMMWMKEIFEHKIGGLALDKSDPASPAAPPPMDKKGFAFAMLREQARAEGNLSAVAQDANETMLTNAARRGSASRSVDSRKSMYSLAAAGEPNNLINRKAFKKSTTTITPSMTPRESGSMTQESASRLSSSLSTSGTNSSSTSKRNSTSDEDRDHTAVLQLKGLPPQEAILSRKLFRATSVDLTNEGGDPKLNGADDDLNGEPPAGSRDGSKRLPKNEVSEDRPAVQPKSNGKSTLASRNVKQVVDTELVLTGALAKLEALGDDAPNPEPDSP
jgi:hypothetical protein